MPIHHKPAKSPHDHPELVDELVQELTQQRASGSGIPEIVEEELTYGNKIHVTVIWESWEDVGHEQRGPIILDAYRRARGEKAMFDITQAIGVTPTEAQRLNIKP